MKKILTIAVASIAVSAIADSFSPDIGVTTLSLSLKNNIIPVQFESLVAGTADGKVTADALVCTNNIGVDSHLYVFQNNAYTAWTLTAAGWEAIDTSSLTDGISAGVPAAGETLSVGSAIWLSFPTVPESPKLVSVYGKVATATNSTIMAGTSDSPKNSLVCNPTGATVTGSALAGKLADMATKPVKGDKITYLGGATSGAYFTYTGSVWKKVAGKTITEGLDNLPANGGFWYFSKGGGGSISWAE